MNLLASCPGSSINFKIRFNNKLKFRTYPVNSNYLNLIVCYYLILNYLFSPGQLSPELVFFMQSM